jgi:hypothetical protein
VSGQPPEIFYNSLPSPIGILAIQACERDAAHLIACRGNFRSILGDSKEFPIPKNAVLGGFGQSLCSLFTEIQLLWVIPDLRVLGRQRDRKWNNENAHCLLGPYSIPAKTFRD